MAKRKHKKKFRLELVNPETFDPMYIITEYFEGYTFRGIKREARKEQLNSGLGCLTAVLKPVRGKTMFFRDYNAKTWTEVKL